MRLLGQHMPEAKGRIVARYAQIVCSNYLLSTPKVPEGPQLRLHFA